jgi:hypothetical protein
MSPAIEKSTHRRARALLCASQVDRLFTMRIAAALRAELPEPWFELTLRERGLRARADRGDPLPTADLALLVLSPDFVASEPLLRDAAAAISHLGGARALVIEARPAGAFPAFLEGIPRAPENGALSANKHQEVYRLLASEVREMAERACADGAAVTAPAAPPFPLDTGEFHWSRREAAWIHETLARAYPATAQIRHVARCASVDVREWSHGGGSSGAWASLLDLAARQGKLRRLVEHVLADASVAGFHPRLRAALGLPG